MVVFNIQQKKTKIKESDHSCIIETCFSNWLENQPNLSRQTCTVLRSLYQGHKHKNWGDEQNQRRLKSSISSSLIPQF